MHDAIVGKTRFFGQRIYYHALLFAMANKTVVGECDIVCSTPAI